MCKQITGKKIPEGDENGLTHKSYLFLGLLLVLIQSALAILRPLTGDEAATISVVNDNSVKAITSLYYSGDYNPPIFFLLTRISKEIFGDSVISLRLVSVASYAGAVGLFPAFFRSIKSKNCVLLALASAINPLILYYGSIARAYMLALFATMVAFVAIAKYLETGSNLWAVILAAVTFLSGATHFYAGLWVGIAALALYAINRRDDSLRAVLIVGFSGSLCLAYLGPFLVKSVDALALSSNLAALDFYERYLFVMYGLVFGETTAPRGWIFLLPCMSSILGIIGVIKIWRMPPILTQKRSIVVWILSIMAFIGVVSCHVMARGMYGIFVVPFMLFVFWQFLEILHKYASKLYRALVSAYIFSAVLALASIATNYRPAFVNAAATIDYREWIREIERRSSGLVYVTPAFNTRILASLNPGIRARLVGVDSIDARYLVADYPELLLEEVGWGLLGPDSLQFRKFLGHCKPLKEEKYVSMRGQERTLVRLCSFAGKNHEIASRAR